MAMATAIASSSGSGGLKIAKPLTALHPSSSSTLSHIPLSKDTIDTFQPAKVFSTGYIEPEANFTSLCFDDRGELLLSSAEDETLQIWSCTSGRRSKKLYSKKYGVDLARFTHSQNEIIYASTKTDNTIRLQDVTDNVYKRYFKGHEAKVTALEMSPIDDSFLSAAKNESVRLWDKRSSTCQGLFPIQGHPLIAFDPDGIIFAIAVNENACILFYELRNFAKVSTRIK
jgi:COMPASS component SWD2